MESASLSGQLPTHQSATHPLKRRGGSDPPGQPAPISDPPYGMNQAVVRRQISTPLI